MMEEEKPVKKAISEVSGYLFNDKFISQEDYDKLNPIDKLGYLSVTQRTYEDEHGEVKKEYIHTHFKSEL